MNRPLKFGYLGALACFGKESRVPLELLEIIGGQPFKGAIPESAQADFLKFATKGPVDRLNNLRQSLGVRLRRFSCTIANFYSSNSITKTLLLWGMQAFPSNNDSWK